MERLKVLAVIDHLGGGGAEGQFLELVKRVNRDKFDLRVFLTEGGGQRLDEALESLPEIYYPSREIKRNTPKALLRLLSTIKKTSPDVIMAWLSYSIALTAFTASLLGKKNLIFSERSSLERLFNVEVRLGGLKKFILKKAFSRGTFVVTNSKEVADEFNCLGYAEKAKTRVIYNGVDLKRFFALPPRDSLREGLGLSSNKLYGVFVGKLEYRKGITFLIEALEGLSMPNLEFLVIGTGTLEDRVRNCRRITYLGYRDNAVEYIKASDFLILPSLYEGLPNVVLEAMAVGTPVIATSVSGVPEIVEHKKTGLLISPEDPEALKAAIVKISGSKELQDALAMHAFEKIKDFDMDKMVQSYEGLFIEAGSIKE